ncbi:hypothetical protein JNJ66_01525 [Candidatus Saccharibacteria bacterium]|nr:hypothetical protein [Candidatus Saccharibacteria bacterium]
MYRTSELRFTKVTETVPDLTPARIAKLSTEKRVDIDSRIEILQAMAGYKWVGEAAHVISSSKPNAATQEQELACQLLNNMGLAYQFDWIERPGRYFSWIQFAINASMLDMFMDKENPFTVVEQGAVYGYPVSSTLAYAGVIPARREDKKSVANAFLSGVNSEAYYEREVEYAEKIWGYLRQLAPELIKEAEEDYKK